ncbi:MAG: carbohydrate ABC transporter permease [Lachnospiraceae bacterium]|nr:carbohydrate ABC transporter permease [Lachnospiraceae bacterium]
MAFCILWLYPVYIIIVNSFKSRSEMYANSLALPSELSLQYYTAAFAKMNFFIAFKNSLVVTVISVIFIVILTSMTAWMFVRTNNTLSKILFSIIIVTMLVPFQTIMMPLMQEMNMFQKATGLQFKDSIGGLIFMYIGFGAGMGVFLYHGFIRSSCPVSLEEAAMIDGASTWRVFWQIVFPILKPITVTVAILDVIWIWNDYLLPSLTLTSQDNKTIPLAMALFFGQYNIEWNMSMAALTFSIIPVIVFYLSAQKYIIKGIAAGAVKG